MLLPEGFVFSQTSLQDYCDCQRRFQLRYLEHRVWPAPQTADALESERRMRLGHSFHRLMRQAYSGLAPAALDAVARAEPELALWWRNHQAAPPQDLPSGLREAELTLAVGLGAQRLEARYDLLAGEPGGRWEIVDWKTAPRRTPPWVLRERLQTRIYPWVLVQAGSTLNGGVPIAAGQVEMLYWFAEFPAQPERFPYSAEQAEADGAFLQKLLDEIRARPPDAFAKIDERKRCKFCAYRSLCWQDVQVGRWVDLGEEEQAEVDVEELDLDAVAPIPY